MGDPMVVFDGVSKKFRRGERHDSLRDLIPAMARRAFRRRGAADLEDREFWAVRDVSFRVNRGEALGIIGPNGAGKSTTLKLLTRILKPTVGQCATRGRVGALIEIAAGFHQDLTGRENIYLQGAIMGMRRAEIAARFDEIVDFAGVSDFIDTPVKRYSSGMNARLGFSIAAHLDPEVLIIDEVLSVGDMAFQRKCFDRMLEFKRDGVAIVLVSHNLQAVASLCDRSLYLASSVQAYGSTSQVMDAYVRASHLQSAGSDSQSSDRAVTFRNVAFATGDGHVALQHHVAPGAVLTVRIDATAAPALDDVTFGFMICRSTDHLVVYNGNIHARDVAGRMPLIGPFSIDFSFRAHLVRGHYYVSIHLFDNRIQAFITTPTPVGTVVVEETKSWAGIADVELEAVLRSPAATPDAEAVAVVH